MVASKRHRLRPSKPAGVSWKDVWGGGSGINGEHRAWKRREPGLDSGHGLAIRPQGPPLSPPYVPAQGAVRWAMASTQVSHLLPDPPRRERREARLEAHLPQRGDGHTGLHFRQRICTGEGAAVPPRWRHTKASNGGEAADDREAGSPRLLCPLVPTLEKAPSSSGADPGPVALTVLSSFASVQVVRLATSYPLKGSLKVQFFNGKSYLGKKCPRCNF